MSKTITILVAGAVDASGKVTNFYSVPDHLSGFPNPPFSVNHSSTGFYDINFNGTIFDDAPGPIVNTTVYGQPQLGDGISPLDGAAVTDIKRSYARIKTGDSKGNTSDRSFFFTAVGSYEVNDLFFYWCHLTDLVQ